MNGAWRKGRYISGAGSASSFEYFRSPATPTTVAHGFCPGPDPGIRTRLPTGSAPAKTRRANDSLIITAGAGSSSLSQRPAASRIPNAWKYPAETE